MIGLLLTPPVLSLVVLAAHFSRHDVPVLPWVCLILPLVLLVRRPWVPRLLQLVLIVGAIEWLRTTVMLARERMDAGEPWLRMAVILVAVAFVAVGSVLLMESERVRQRYATETSER
jgi:ABC-type Na+ efflux pump permease subunit